MEHIPTIRDPTTCNLRCNVIQPTQPEGTTMSEKSPTMAERVAAEIKRAQLFDRHHNVVLRNQVIRQLGDIPGVSVQYLDAAIRAAGLK